MCSKKQVYKISSPSMGSTHGYSERLKPFPSSNTEKLNLWDGGDQPQGDSCPSDCESGISGPGDDQPLRLCDNGLIRISNGEAIYETIKKHLGSSLSSCRVHDVQVESIHRVDYSGIMNRAKLHCFGIYLRAVGMNRGGDANVKYAWYGGSMNEIVRILSHGFGLPDNARACGLGVNLSPVNRPIESLRSQVADEDGVRHWLLCRVIMGKSEIVRACSGQYNPSSEEFDSGVDDLVSPQKYIVWSSHMNTHILPEFVVSFKAPDLFSDQRSFPPRGKPKSDWMPLGALIAVLSNYLPHSAIELISKHLGDYKRKKLTRHEMIQKVRRIAGDELLMEAIKTYGGKIKASWSKG